MKIRYSSILCKTFETDAVNKQKKEKNYSIQPQMQSKEIENFGVRWECAKKEWLTAKHDCCEVMEYDPPNNPDAMNDALNMEKVARNNMVRLLSTVLSVKIRQKDSGENELDVINKENSLTHLTIDYGNTAVKAAVTTHTLKQLGFTEEELIEQVKEQIKEAIQLGYTSQDYIEDYIKVRWECIKIERLTAQQKLENVKRELSVKIRQKDSGESEIDVINKGQLPE